MKRTIYDRSVEWRSSDRHSLPREIRPEGEFDDRHRNRRESVAYRFRVQNMGQAESWETRISIGKVATKS